MNPLPDFRDALADAELIHDRAALQTAITREMIAAKINEKTANLRQQLMNILTRAIAQAVPSG